MSDEETGVDAADTTADGAATDVQGEQPPASGASSAAAGSPEGVDSAAAGVHAGQEVRVSEAAGQQAALAAPVLGDTLPSAVLVGAGGHGDGHGHGNGHGDEHFAHTLSMKILGGVLGALIVLTVLTVAVTSVDLGSQGNFIVAMIIATIKAALVMGYFMHLVWDSKFNVFVFLSSFLFVLLFLSMALLDRGEYQSDINRFEADQQTAK